MASKKAGIASVPASNALEMKNLQDALDGAQKSIAAHAKAFAALHRVIQGSLDQSEAASNILSDCIDRILASPPKETTVDRLCTFVYKAATSEGFEVAISCLRHTMKSCDAADKNVRVRACQLINGLLGSLGESADLSEEDITDIIEAVSPRLCDKQPAVRLHAIGALNRLVNVNDPSDPLTLDFIRLLETDISKDVRKAALTFLPVTKSTIPHFVKRIRDVEEDIRRTTFELLAKKVDVKALSIQQRVYLLKHGLSDRSPSVRSACTHLLVRVWLSKADNDVVKLLEWLDAETHEETSEQAARLILQEKVASTCTAKAEVDLDGLTPEGALCFRVHCQVLVEANREDELELLRPEVSTYCGLLTRYQTSSRFVVKQLLLLGPLLDFMDDFGRKRLTATLHSLMLQTETPEPFIKLIMQLLTVFYERDEAEFVSFSISALNEIKERLIPSSKASQSSSSKARRDLDQRTWLRCLSITSELLENTSRDLSNASIVSLLPTIVRPAVEHTNPIIREAGVRALGLYCLLGKSAIDEHVQIFLDLLANEVEQMDDDGDIDMGDDDAEKDNVEEDDGISSHAKIRMLALKFLFDMLLMHPHSSFGGGVEASASASSPSHDQVGYERIVATLSAFLDNEASSPLRTLACEGFAKLLFMGRIQDNDKVIARLLFLLFDASTKEETDLRQTLSSFFQVFALTSLSRQQSLSRALSSAIRAGLASDPKNFPSSEMAKFVIELTSPSALVDRSKTLGSRSLVRQLQEASADEKNVHGQLARDFCMHIMAEPSAAFSKTLARLLPLLQLVSGAIDSTREALLLTEMASAQLTDKISKTACTKFIKAAAENLGGIPLEPFTAEEEAKLQEAVDTLKQVIEIATAASGASAPKSRSRRVAAVAKKAAPAAKAASSRSTRRRQVESSSEDEEDEEEEEQSQSEEEEAVIPVPRSRKAAVAAKKPSAAPRRKQEEESDDEEEEEEEELPLAKNKKRVAQPAKPASRTAALTHVKFKAQIAQEFVEAEGDSDEEKEAVTMARPAAVPSGSSSSASSSNTGPRSEASPQQWEQKQIDELLDSSDEEMASARSFMSPIPNSVRKTRGSSMKKFATPEPDYDDEDIDAMLMSD